MAVKEIIAFDSKLLDTTSVYDSTQAKKQSAINADTLTALGTKINYTDALTLEEIEASTDLSNKVAAAAAVETIKESLSTIGTRHQATLSGTLSTSYTTLTGSLILTAGTYFVYAAASTGGSNNACVGLQVMLDGTTICGNNNGNNALHLLTTSGGTVTVKAQGNASVSISADVRFSYILAVRIA